MQISHQKKRNRLILIGFAMLLALGIVNLESLPFSKKDIRSTTYPQPAKKEDLADTFIRQASQNFYYREFPEAAENYYKAIAIYESLGDLHIMAREISEAEDNYVEPQTSILKLKTFRGKQIPLKTLAIFT